MKTEHNITHAQTHAHSNTQTHTHTDRTHRNSVNGPGTLLECVATLCKADGYKKNTEKKQKKKLNKIKNKLLSLKQRIFDTLYSLYD